MSDLYTLTRNSFECPEVKVAMPPKYTERLLLSMPIFPPLFVEYCVTQSNIAITLNHHINLEAIEHTWEQNGAKYFFNVIQSLGNVDLDAREINLALYFQKIELSHGILVIRQKGCFV